MKTVKQLSVSLIILLAILGCFRDDDREVVVYTSLDQIFSEPILTGFEEKTRISVKAAYDTEASKTTGLVNRLMAEAKNPQADVFWNSEVGRTILLKRRDLLAPYRSPSAADIPSQFKDKDGYWTGFAARARVLIYNTELVGPQEAPRSIFELTDPPWRGQVALANPLFGTTATHVAALFVLLGDERAKAFFRDLRDNDVVIVPGNSTSRDMVCDGELAVGFTDTDDANMAIVEGKPVNVVYPDDDGMGTLLIPNTVALIRDGPNPKEGKRLIDHLLSEEVESILSFSKSAQMPLRRGVKRPDYVPSFDSIQCMQVNYETMADRMEETGKFLHRLFIR